MHNVARDELEAILQTQFIGLAERYLPRKWEEGLTYGEYIKNKLLGLEEGEFLVPVLGMQGTGKSSMLNALLMDDIILPVDADETTCIPVEIRYGVEKDGEIEVYFNDDSPVKLLDRAKELEQYVHNTYNPGNEKNVSHIVLYKRNELLKNNLILVDLPGVGSITAKNVETTMRYIERLNGAIFLLRTVPPITRPERIFLANVWPKLTAAWFVQNQWNDESDKEVLEGKTHNLNVLKEIAKQYKAEANFEIRVINIYQAMNARFEHDTEAYADSGIKDFSEFLNELSKTWKYILRSSIIQEIKLHIICIKDGIVERREELSLSQEDLQAKHREAEKNYEEAYRANRRRINQIEDKISRYRNELTDEAYTQSQIQKENLRNEMRRIIGSGVVDGRLLDEAFQENAKSCSEDTMENISLKLHGIQGELRADIEALQVKNLEGKITNLGSFYRGESLKFEKSLPAIGAIGGGLAGLELGMMIGTAIGGPIGTVVGGIVGIGITFVAGWLGTMAKAEVGKVRQKYTLNDLEPNLRQFEDQLRTTIEDLASNAFTQIDEALIIFKDSQYSAMQDERSKHQVLQHDAIQNLNATRQCIEVDASQILEIERKFANAH